MGRTVAGIPLLDNEYKLLQKRITVIVDSLTYYYFHTDEKINHKYFHPLILSSSKFDQII